MKKRIIIPLLISTLSLSGCCLFSHDFAEATCTTPSTCTKCGEIQGEALGHTFTDATCTEAKTCSVCNFTEGNPLAHQWIEATTEKPKTCDLCGLTEGEPLQDDFSQAKIDEYEVETEAPVEKEPGPVDSTGDDVELEDDDYVEPSQEEVVEPETTPTPAPEITQGEGPTEDSVRANLDKQLADGVITKEVYDECIAMLGNMTFDGQGGYDVKPSSEPQVITSDTALKGTPDTGESAGSFDFDGPRNPDLAGDFIQ